MTTSVDDCEAGRVSRLTGRDAAPAFTKSARSVNRVGNLGCSYATFQTIQRIVSSSPARTAASAVAW